MKAIILAAGKSTRTYPLTITRPKPLLPFLDGTILTHTIDMLKEIGFTEVILVVNYKKEMIIEKIGREYNDVKITYVVQEQPLGTGDAVRVAKDCFNEGEKFIVLMGDDIYSPNTIRELMKECPSIGVREVKTPQLYGIYEWKEKEGKMIATGLEEKPEEPKTNLANLGLYYFESDFFNFLDDLKPSPRGEIEITDAIKEYMKKEIRLVTAEDYWLPVGHPWDLLTATERLIENKNIIQSTITAEIKCCCVIGKNVNIGKGSLIENSVIFDNVTIGENCLIRNSVIGENVRIGNNVKTVENGEVFSKVKDKMVKVNRPFGCAMGDNVVIKDNSELHPGVKIWPEKVVEGIVKEDVD